MANGRTRFSGGSVWDAIQQSEKSFKQEVLSAAQAADEIAEPAPPVTKKVTKSKDLQQPTVETTPEETAVDTAKSAQKKEETPLPTATASGLSALSILDKNNKYKNSKQQINIDENYRQFISLIADLYDISISQVTNNMLKVVFNNELLIKELKAVASKKYKEKMSTIDLKLSNL
ncbi:hypothetical protein AGMMS4956_19700 [Bacteroidia bacterium]|nr:hypothetical protein AGMMS4956_19700 [Bacteroidia bacterium]